ncbi:hypothetical protein [Pantoea dispersa]|uniref:hypothetical protein n=1 Tax=Pantoea dispersa TaxID=59814 RepID=UPI001331B4A0|nr:hypothetical protein [Pantoea dispersa]KAF0854794.1 hypothetical protein Y788_18745 [Pantoea dispersa 625]
MMIWLSRTVITLGSTHIIKVGKKMGKWWERWGACPRIPHFFPVFIRNVGKTPETRTSTGLSRVLKKQVGSKWVTEKVGSKWGEMREV